MNFGIHPHSIYQTIKIIGNTASLSTFSNEELIEIGFNDFIYKPYKPEEFIFYDARGALPQNVSAARTNSTVQVHVTRFRDPVTPPPGKAAQAFKIENLKFIAIAQREQHPIGIASQGVISIASAATVTDPAGNQTAQQQHRVIAQALPQEAIRSKHFETQRPPICDDHNAALSIWI